MMKRNLLFFLPYLFSCPHTLVEILVAGNGLENMQCGGACHGDANQMQRPLYN